MMNGPVGAIENALVTVTQILGLLIGVGLCLGILRFVVIPLLTPRRNVRYLAGKRENHF